MYAMQTELGTVLIIKQFGHFEVKIRVGSITLICGAGLELELWLDKVFQAMTNLIARDSRARKRILNWKVSRDPIFKKS